MLVSDISVERRRAIFLALVKTQDRGLGVRHSRRVVAMRFKLTSVQIERIEEEGLYHEWPPLNDAPIEVPADSDVEAAGELEPVNTDAPPVDFAPVSEDGLAA